ncbi:MAG: macro domain-containing protein [Balneolaceae bacterium]
MKITSKHTTVELVIGDITDQPDMDAIVNAANAELRIGGGVAGAIHQKGDPELTQLTRPLAPINPGEAVITKAPGLSNKYVIHCLGPVYGSDEPADDLLANCYKNALYLAEKYELESIAFPAISTGAFGFPMPEAAKIAIESILFETTELDSVKHIRIVLFDEEAFKVHKDFLSEVEV